MALGWMVHALRIGSYCRSVGRSVGQSVGRSVGQSVGWSVGISIDGSVTWLSLKRYIRTTSYGEWS